MRDGVTYMAYKSASHMPINWPYDLVFIDELAESSFAAVFVWNMHVLNKRHMCLKLTQEQVIEKKNITLTCKVWTLYTGF